MIHFFFTYWSGQTFSIRMRIMFNAVDYLLKDGDVARSKEPVSRRQMDFSARSFRELVVISVGSSAVVTCRDNRV